MLSLDKYRNNPRADGDKPLAPVVWPPPDAGHRIGAPLAWSIALATVATAFAIIAIIANYGPLNKEDAALQGALRPVHYPAVSAIINAAGETCTRVCAITPEPSLSGATHFTVDCAGRSSPPSCASPIRYVIAVSRED